MIPHRSHDDETLETLAHRLRRLPPPAVPADLEARLLAAIPATPRARRGRTWLAAAVLLAAAAAALLAVRLPPPIPRAPAAPAADRAPTLWRWEQALQRSDGDAAVVLDRTMPPFEWPLTGQALEPNSNQFN